MKKLKILLVVAVTVALCSVAEAQSWGFGAPGVSFGYSRGRGGQSWGFNVGGSWFSYGNGACWGGGAPYGPVFFQNNAPPGVYGGWGPGPNPGFVRRNCPTAYTSGWVIYPNTW